MRRLDAEGREHRIAGDHLGDAAVELHRRADLVEQPAHVPLRALVVARGAVAGDRLGLDEHHRDQATAGNRCGAWLGRLSDGTLGRGHVEDRILGEDQALEVAQATSRLHPVLVEEVAGQLPVARQRLGRPSAAVQHEQPLLLQALAQAVLRGRCLDVRRDLRVPAQGQIRLEPVLQRLHPALLEARRLEPDQVRVAASRERWPAPEGQGRAQELARRRDVSARQPGARLGGQPLEPARVDVVGGDAEDVAGRAGVQHAVAERRPESRNDGLDGVRRVPGGSPLPDRLHQHVGRDDGSGAGREARQQRPLVAPLHRYRAILVVEDREVAQDGDPHRCLRVRA